MNEQVTLRLFQAKDVNSIARLFHDTVRQINIRDYSLAQVTAWSPDDIYFQDWLNACSGKFTYIAEQNSNLLGFGQLENNGYIDCFYVHYLHQGRGIGRQIYRAIEDKARELNLSCLSAEVSITAKPFFICQGFIQIEEQQIMCRGEMFINYVMKKTI